MYSFSELELSIARVCSHVQEYIRILIEKMDIVYVHGKTPMYIKTMLVYNS